ncbi:MAG TPA: hypothetical protein VK861_01710, partial [Bacteroidales bacterium]|nr:hypothetical protein [Bacteroidales bacterium]
MNNTRMQRRERQKNSPILEGFILLIFLFASFTFMEIILRINTESIFFNDGLLFSVLFAGITSLIIYLAASFFKGRARTGFVGIALGVVTFLFASQLIYYKIFKTFYTVFSARNGGQVLEFLNDIIFALGQNVLWLILLFIPLIAFTVLSVMSGKSRYTFSWMERGIAVLILVVLFGAALLGINMGDKEANSAYDVYYKNNYPVASVNRLGLVTSMRLDLQRTLTGFEPALAPPPLA